MFLGDIRDGSLDTFFVDNLDGEGYLICLFSGFVVFTHIDVICPKRGVYLRTKINSLFCGIYTARFICL